MTNDSIGASCEGHWCHAVDSLRGCRLAGFRIPVRRAHVTDVVEQQGYERPSIRRHPGFFGQKLAVWVCA